MLFRVLKFLNYSIEVLYFIPYAKRLFVRVNDKNGLRFSIILFLNGKSRNFITLIYIMVSKFNIVITVFKTCRRQISISNTKYYEAPFQKLGAWEYDIIITKLPETWWRAAKIETFILGFSYNSFQNIVQVLQSFCGWLRRFDPNLFNLVAAYKPDFSRNMASENSQEALGVNTFTLML